MPVVFPNPNNSTSEGLVAVGGILDAETLHTAYTNGIFPWPIPNEELMTWFSPNPRGILELKDVYYNRSFKRFLNSTDFKVKFNTNFEEVISHCANVKRSDENSTWINAEIIESYTEMFRLGLAYCVEVYDDNIMVGGMYGICIGELISGESMFHFKSNASKLALFSLIEKLKKSQISWIDTQMVTPVIEKFGGKEIPRSDFLNRIKNINTITPSRQELFL